MALNKVTYVDGQTVITAENLNDIQDAIIALENAPAQGLTEDMKQALLQIARKVAYIDDQGQTYYDDLYDALYPPKTVVLITAVFEQGSTVIYDDTAMDDLKQYLTVTAKYDDNTTAILADGAYTLSGLLEAPSSTVTVAYNGLTTTFTVDVTARPTLTSISAVYTQSGTVYDTDTLDSLKADLVVTANYSDSSTQTVPAADYTLSGELEAGQNTITVSYGGKNTTFSVTVTAWTWNYEASSGELLSAQDYVTMTTNGEGGTESLENGVLVLHTDSHVGTSGASYLRYLFANSTSNHAILQIRAKVVSTTTALISGGINSANGFRMQLSNGTSGTQACVINDGSGNIMIKYIEGNTPKAIPTNYPLDSEYHLFELELNGSNQSFRMDGVEMLNSNTLSTYYTMSNAIFNQAAGDAWNPGGVITDIEFVRFLEVS